MKKVKVPKRNDLKRGSMGCIETQIKRQKSFEINRDVYTGDELHEIIKMKNDWFRRRKVLNYVILYLFGVLSFVQTILFVILLFISEEFVHFSHVTYRG